MKRDLHMETRNRQEVTRLKRRLARAEHLLSVATVCACDTCRPRIERFLRSPKKAAHPKAERE